MPQILRYPDDVLKVTLSGTPNVATALVLPHGTRSVTLWAETTAAKVALDGTDLVAIGDHYYPLPADVGSLLPVPLEGFPTQRWSARVTVATNPTDGETWELIVGSATEVYEFDDDAAVTLGNTSVTIAGTAALTATNLAAALAASTTLAIEGAVNARTTTQVDAVTTAASPIEQKTGTVGTKVVTEVLGPLCPVIYLASATASQVVRVMASSQVEWQ